MELSSSNIKRFLIFSQKKAFLIFRETDTPKKFFIFQETESSNPKLKKLLIFQEELPKPEKQTSKSRLKTFPVFLLDNIKNTLG